MSKPPGDPERLLGHELVLDNATFRLLGVTPAWTRYLVLDFRASAVSDDKRDFVLRSAVNLATGALPDAVLAAVAPCLDAADETTRRLPVDAELPATVGSARGCWTSCARALPPRLEPALDPFVKGLRRRLAVTRTGCISIITNCITRRCSACACAARGRSETAARGTAGRGDRARISRQAGRPRAAICHAGHGRVGADAGTGDAGASFRGADPPAQGGADHAPGLEPGGAAAGAAGLRGHVVYRASAAGLRRRAASRGSRGVGPLHRLRASILPRLPPSGMS